MPIWVISKLKILIEEQLAGFDNFHHWHLQGGVVGQSLQESVHIACLRQFPQTHRAMAPLNLGEDHIEEDLVKEGHEDTCKRGTESSRSAAVAGCSLTSRRRSRYA
jgi:hypothetical protein